MDAEDAADRFAALFPDVYRRFHRRVHHAEYQLTSESLAIVQHLADSGPLTVTEAARHMDRSQAAMSELFARLVSRGLLARMPDERDRRRVLVWLTEAGREALASARSVLSPDLLAPAFERVAPADRASLIENMQALVEGSTRRSDR
ncbi:MAG: MarR family winged helix-turn-helix transcriptional regulator [Planctomycetota bacterium]